MVRILLVEPDIILGHSYSRAFQVQGHEVIWKTSAQAAIATVDHQIPDIIVLDISMPLHNGIEFLYELRSYRDCRDIPVIALGAIPLKSMNDNDQWRQLKALYLYKPNAKLVHLTRMVENICLTA